MTTPIDSYAGPATIGGIPCEALLSVTAEPVIDEAESARTGSLCYRPLYGWGGTIQVREEHIADLLALMRAEPVEIQLDGCPPRRVVVRHVTASSVAAFGEGTVVGTGRAPWGGWSP